MGCVMKRYRVCQGVGGWVKKVESGSRLWTPPSIDLASVTATYTQRERERGKENTTSCGGKLGIAKRVRNSRILS